jgi:hypothetical protein
MLSGPGARLYTVPRTFARPTGGRVIALPAGGAFRKGLDAAPDPLSYDSETGHGRPARSSPAKLTHLARLEAESIHIMREVAAEFPSRC